MGDRLDARRELADAARREGQAHQAAEPRVLGRVHDQHAARDVLGREAGRGREDARPRLWIAQDRLAVGVPEHGDDGQALVAPGGVLAPRAGEERVRVAAGRLVEGVEGEGRGGVHVHLLRRAVGLIPDAALGIAGGAR